MIKTVLRFILFMVAMVYITFPASGNAATRLLNLYVLDFDNLRADPSVAWLSNGLADMLRHDFSELEGVRVFGRSELEQILQDRSVFLRQPSGTGNVLVMGSFLRDLDRVKVNVQLLSIANWDELGRVSTGGSVNQISQLGKDLFDNTSAVLGPQIPSQKRGLLRPPMAKGEPPEYRDQVRQMRSSLSGALEDLEESMDLYIGAREKVEGAGESEGKYYRDFSFDASGEVVDVPSKDMELLEGILFKISKNPYTVDIGKPSIEVDEKKDDNYVHLSIPVRYSLRENLIKDMLSSLPYTAMRQDGSVTSLQFSRRKFRISDDLAERISRGGFRVVPVVQLLDRKGNVRTVILDSPDPYWHRQTSQTVSFTTEHKFSPLVVFSVSGWSLQVTMESAEIDAVYELDLSRQEVGSFSRVQVEFVPETQLTQYLSAIL